MHHSQTIACFSYQEVSLHKSVCHGARILTVCLCKGSHDQHITRIAPNVVAW